MKIKKVYDKHMDIHTKKKMNIHKAAESVAEKKPDYMAGGISR